MQEVRWPDVRQENVAIASARTTGVAATGQLARRWRQRLAVVLLMCAVALSPHAASQEWATRMLTILAAHCPAGYADDASADECDDAPMPDVTFRVGRTSTDFEIRVAVSDAGQLSAASALIRCQIDDFHRCPR